MLPPQWSRHKEKKNYQNLGTETDVGRGLLTKAVTRGRSREAVRPGDSAGSKHPSHSLCLPLISCQFSTLANPAKCPMQLSLLGERRGEKTEYSRGTEEGGYPAVRAALLAHFHGCSVYGLTDDKMYWKGFSYPYWMLLSMTSRPKIRRKWTQ